MAVDGGLGTVGVRRLGLARGELPLLARQIPLARLAVAAVAIPTMIVVMALFGPADHSARARRPVRGEPPLRRVQSGVAAAGHRAHDARRGWRRSCACSSSRVVVVAAGARSGRPGRRRLGRGRRGRASRAPITSSCSARCCRAGVRPAAVRCAALVALAREAAPLGLSNFVWAAAQYMPLFLVGSIVGGAQVGWFAAGAAARELGRHVQLRLSLQPLPVARACRRARQRRRRTPDDGIVPRHGLA